MPLRFFHRLLVVAIMVSLSWCVTGCDGNSQTSIPEDGSVEAYLQAHPEELEDDPDEAGSEDEEFEAGS